MDGVPAVLADIGSFNHVGGAAAQQRRRVESERRAAFRQRTAKACSGFRKRPCSSSSALRATKP